MSVAVTMNRQSKISGFFAKKNKRLFPQDEGDGRGEVDPCDLGRPTAQQPHGTSDQPGGPQQAHGTSGQVHGPQQPLGPGTDTRPRRRVGLLDIGKHYQRPDDTRRDRKGDWSARRQ